MRRAPCRRASSSVWAEAARVAEATAMSVAPAFRIRRREGLLLEPMISSLRILFHHLPGNRTQQGADIHWSGPGVDWRDQGRLSYGILNQTAWDSASAARH